MKKEVTDIAGETVETDVINCRFFLRKNTHKEGSGNRNQSNKEEIRNTSNGDLIRVKQIPGGNFSL
jgi:hypothetical protein